MNRPPSVPPASGPAGDCPDDERIFAFLEGRDEDRAAVSAHLASCSDCRSLVGLLAGARSTSIGAPSSSPQPGGEVRPGDVIGDKYEVVSILGRGGMGYVALAVHRTLHQQVALKLMLGAIKADPTGVVRFFREARTAASLGSEHIARALDAGTLPSGEPFVVFEYLEGQDLAARLRSAGALPIELAVDLVIQACEALALAHRRGIVHRDIKPANLFVTTGNDGSPLLKVLDFGIAKVETPGSIDATGPDAVLGSPRYMSPEQIERSASVDARTDVWALGVTLYELLTGQGPFGGTTMLEVCAAIAVTEPPSVSTLRPQVPPPLAAAIAQTLRKNPNQRTASVRDLAVAIAPFASEDGRALVRRIERVVDGASASVPRVSLPDEPRPATAPVDDSLSASAGPRHRERGSAAIAGVVLSVIAVVGLVAATLLWLRKDAASVADATANATTPLRPEPAVTALASHGAPSDAPPSATATATNVASASAPAIATTRPGSGPRPPRPSVSATPSAAPVATAAPSPSLDRSGLTDRK